MLRFLWVTGCRVAEMCNARLDRCEAAGSEVWITVTGKGRKERRVVLPRDLFDEVRSTFVGTVYLFEQTGREPLPLNPTYVTNRIRGLGRKWLDRRVTAHTLRHSWATRKVQAYPGKLDAVSRQLGHSSPAITLAMYVHTNLDADELLDDGDRV